MLWMSEDLVRIHATPYTGGEIQGMRFAPFGQVSLGTFRLLLRNYLRLRQSPFPSPTRWIRVTLAAGLASLI
jgi:hypothetical protein